MKTVHHIGIAGDCNPYEFAEYLSSIDTGINFTTTATAVTTYIKELLCSGYNVTVFTTHLGRDGYFEFYGERLSVFVVPQSHKIRGMALFSRIYVSKRLYNVMKDHVFDLDVLHAQWTYEAAVASLKFANHIPTFCTVRDWCPLIMKMQNRLRDKIVWYISYLYCFKKVFSDRHLHYIANSQYTWERIKTLIPENRIDIIPNPIEKCYVLESKKNTNVSESFISICGYLEDPRKNILVLVEAFNHFRQEHSKSKLILIGNCSESFKERIAAANNNTMDGITLAGSVSHKDLFNYIDNAHCLVHPALEETFGNILLEAMARKVVCIGGQNSGAVPQVLEQGKAGILCDVGDAKSIEKAMLQSLDTDKCAALIEYASNKINEKYKSDINMQQTIKVYEKFFL